jgi:hypothetical protein
MSFDTGGKRFRWLPSETSRETHPADGTFSERATGAPRCKWTRRSVRSPEPAMRYAAKVAERFGLSMTLARS